MAGLLDSCTAQVGPGDLITIIHYLLMFGWLFRSSCAEGIGLGDPPHAVHVGHLGRPIKSICPQVRQIDKSMSPRIVESRGRVRLGDK